MLSLVGNDNSSYTKVIQSLMEDDGVSKKQREFKRFGDEKFLTLEQLKENFPPPNGKIYCPEDTYEFARRNGIDYFIRHKAYFLKQIKYPKKPFVPDLLPSQFARSVFLFFKYYIHNQSPGKSDFLDFAFISYLPYFDIFITEKNVANVINHVKTTTNIFQEIEILSLSEFKGQLANQ